ncbi:nucleotide-diphospho-sugar transferase [Pavlovales sp. CCMP2436]|nr:nucleotide-diphospho-sugar transferase [Pavlovales sp. CCMP2436]
MKAVILIGALDILRPLTLSLPQPLVEFCNKTLLLHQLEALKAAGVQDVVLCVNEKNLPKTWNEVISQYEAELGMRIQVSMETSSLGTAGPLKLAQGLITNDGSSQEPFFVLNGDVLCSFPLKDMIHVHMKHKGVGTIMTTRNAQPSRYGVVVGDIKTGKIEHFVNRPETFVSDLINAGLYIFNPSIFDRLPGQGEKASMNAVLPALATEGPNCVLESGVRLQDTTLFSGVTVGNHALVHDSVIGWNSRIGGWAWLTSAVLAEDVTVKQGTLVNGATVLPHKELTINVREPQIII